jgi:integrase
MSRRIKHYGGQHETKPIKSDRELAALYDYFYKKCDEAKTPVKKYQADRNLMLIHVGLNTAFRAEDLLQLRVCDVEKGYVSIKENKTGKMQNFRMTKELHEDILEYVAKYNLKSHDYMFRGQQKFFNGRAYVYPITRKMAWVIVSNAGKAIGLPYTFGVHSLRKTFGYQYIKHGGKPLTLMKMYNHDSIDVTQLYVCWGKEDAEHDRNNFYIGPGFEKRKMNIGENPKHEKDSKRERWRNA